MEIMEYHNILIAKKENFKDRYLKLKKEYSEATQSKNVKS